ncbi:MAG TPA: hypothetical protein VGI12_03570 [Vicinamibacterales bacterium]
MATVARPSVLFAFLLVVALLVVAGPAAAASSRKQDPLAAARQFYNLGQYEQAIAAAQEAATHPAAAGSARLIMARSRLERYRTTAAPGDLDDARADLRAVDPLQLEARERIELQVGLGELFYLEERFGAAAELLAPVIERTASQAPDAHVRALDWWASAVDRQAQALPASDRAPMYTRLIARMEEELRREPGSPAAAYWIAAAARASGDLDRAWSAAMAGWVSATLARDRGVALRADLDKLVTEGIIPDRAGRAPAQERRQTVAALAAEWETFKSGW